MKVIDTPRVTAKAISAKIERVRAGKPPRTLDLFSGCGGISLGFLAAGFQMTGAIEFDPIAARTHSRNFFSCDAEHGKALDITKFDPAQVVEHFGLGKSLSNCIDVLVGGPPCQAFARVGRAKLREIDDHPRAFKHDARGNLYLRYLHYVEAFRPLAVLIENVPDMMNYGGHNIAD